MNNQAEHLRVIEGEGMESLQPNQDDPLIGKTIDGRYQVESILGEGGMGLVYKARHTVLGKPLAIKVLRPDVSKDEEIMTRFRQEAQSASNIGNQHIIDISDFGTLPDSSTYFVMEFLDGVDLTHVVEHDAPVNAGRVLHITGQLCRALGAAHEIGIVHRDLKPDNIYLVHKGGDSDFVKVLDFGIAKVGGNTSKLTKAGQVFGTPHYMSPEQCAGRAVDQRTDIYALGVIMYEMVTGQVPFDADNLMGILTKHLYEEPIPPSQVAEEGTVQAEFEAVILKCLSKDVDFRYESMDALRLDLEALSRGAMPAAADPNGASPLAGVYTQPSHQISRPATASRGFRKTFVALGALLAVAGVAAIVLAMLRDSSVSNEEPRAAAAAEPVSAGPSLQADEPEQTGLTNTEERSELGAADTAEPDPNAMELTVTVQSDPSNALVSRDGVLIGNTPIEVSAPNRGEAYELELKAEGHRDARVRISHLTQSPLSITLERDRVRARTNTPRTAPRRERRANKTPEPTPMVAPVAPAPVQRMNRMPQSEVLDPWASDG